MTMPSAQGNPKRSIFPGREEPYRIRLTWRQRLRVLFTGYLPEQRIEFHSADITSVATELRRIRSDLMLRTETANPLSKMRAELASIRELLAIALGRDHDLVTEIPNSGTCPATSDGELCVLPFGHLGPCAPRCVEAGCLRIGPKHEGPHVRAEEGGRFAAFDSAVVPTA
jgi:hypothetical protein